jgi:glycosyltransferase involved in cell wall biosynthesis
VTANGRLRVLLDGTALLGPRTGIGRYTAALVAELATRAEVDLTVTGFTARGQRALRAAVPDGVRVRGGPVPARGLRAAWQRGGWPPVELLAGDTDVLHAPNFVLPPARRAAGVVTIHDLAFLDQPGELAPANRNLPNLVRSTARRAAAVCTPSRAVARDVVRRLDVPADRVVVTPLGVDPGWFRATPPPAQLRGELRLPQRYLLFAGTPQPRKGLDVLLDAHQAERDLPPLVLAGPPGWGPPPATSSRVHPVGYLEEEVLRAVVAGATALVLPSRDEGFGLPLAEAMATGTPVVCSNLPALREVADGHATLVPPGDATALATALSTISSAGSDPAGTAHRRAHAAQFTWAACADATMSAYQLALRTP